MTLDSSRAAGFPDPMVLARRMSHRRDHLQVDLTDLRELVNCRRAAEGRYVRDLQEMRFELEERREFGDDVKTGERVLAGGGVARYLRDEIEKTEDTHAAIFAAYDKTADTLATIAENLALAASQANEAVKLALRVPETSYNKSESPMPASTTSTAKDDPLPARLDDPALAQRLLDLHERFEHKHARALKHALKSLELERDEARADLAFWIGRRDDLEGWQPQLEVEPMMDLVRQPSAATPAVLSNDIHRLIIRAAIEPTAPSLPFAALATSALQDELVAAEKLLQTLSLVHSTWRDIALPLLKQHLNLHSKGSNAKGRLRQLRSLGNWHMSLRVMHLNTLNAQSLRITISYAPFDQLRTIIDLPIPLILNSFDPDEEPFVFHGLSSLRSLSVVFNHEVRLSSPLDVVFPDLAALSSLRLNTHHGDLHETFEALARIHLPHLTELQLSGISFRGQIPSSASIQTLALLQTHGADLRSLLLESTATSLDMDWDTLGRAMLGHVPELRNLSTSIPELGLLFERQFRDDCAVIFGHSMLDVARNSLVAGTRCRALLEFCRRLAGVDHHLPWQMRARLRTRSKIKSLTCWQVNFTLEPYRQSTDLALAAHYLQHALGIALIDRHGVPHQDFWVAQSPAEIEALLLREEAQRVGGA